MSQYFSKFPTIIKNKILLTDLVTRFKILDRYIDNEDLYYVYEYQEGDTPEILASKYYGSPELHWIILVTNAVFDPNFEFPMPYEVFNNYIEDKYVGNGGIASLHITNIGSGYNSGIYTDVPLVISNPTGLTKIGTDVTADFIIGGDGSISDLMVTYCGSGYDANTILTFADPNGSGATFTISSFMDPLFYAQSYIHPIFGYRKIERLTSADLLSYTIDSQGNIIVQSDTNYSISSEYYYIDKDSYYNLYNDPSISHPGILATLQDSTQVIFDTVRAPLQTIYDYELSQNESRRVIRILKKEYYAQVLNEFLQLMTLNYS